MPKTLHIISDDIDANRFTEPYTVTFYYFVSTATGTKPFSDGYLIEFMYALSTGAYCVQIAIDDTGWDIAIRTRLSDLSWEAWKHISFS